MSAIKDRELEATAAPLAKACNEEFLSALSPVEKEQIRALMLKVIAKQNPELKP